MAVKSPRIPKCRTIRWSIMKNFTILSIFMSIAFVVAFLFVGFIQSTIILENITNESIHKVEQELKRMTTPVETSLKIVSKLTKIDHFKNMNSQNINQVLIPLFDDLPQIVSFKIAGEDGSIYMLYKSPHGWMIGNKQSNKDGGAVKWFLMRRDMDGIKMLVSDAPFHLGKSAGFKKVISSEFNQIIWSDPHILPFSNTMGVSVSLPVKNHKGQICIFAFDIELSSFSDVLTKINNVKQGTHFIISDNKQHVILANNNFYNSAEQKIITQSRSNMANVKSYVDFAIQYWEAHKKNIARGPISHRGKNELFYYRYEDLDLIGNLRYVADSSNLPVWVGVILDEDKNIMIKRDMSYLLSIPIVLGLALLIAFGMAHSMTRNYSIPIKLLVERSSRISQMDLTEGEAIISPIIELQQLADSQETMRIELKNATEKLEEWGNTCSLQVVERTKEVEAKSNELVKLNDELAKLNKNLEKRVADEVEASGRKDKIMFQSARQAQMGEMLSMIAHQWRQPLSSISTITGSMLVYLELGAFDQEQFKELLNDINNHAQYLSGTINDFRNFFKPNKDKQPAVLADVMDQSINIIGKSLAYKSIQVNTDYQQKIEIFTFPNELMQVFLNILKNAQDVLLERKTKLPTIDIRILDKNETQVIEISDNAGGIPEELQPKVFEPYFSTKDDKTGTGLGLYMSKLIIEKHCQGDLSVTNLEKGACFKITIPSKQ